VLSVLGLSPGEERIYRCLVGGGEMTPQKIAADTGTDPATVGALVAALISRGLAVIDPHTGEITAAPPAVALGALLRQHHDELRAAELDLLALTDEHRRRTISRAAGDLIEVITEIDAVRHRYAQIQEAARSEVRSMVVPNMTVVPYQQQNPVRDAGLRRGVRYRTIVDRPALAQPGFGAAAAESLAAGMQVRVIEHVPIKLIIGDSDVAMLPLLSGKNTAPESVLVRSSGVLDALVAYFEAEWSRAYPLVATGQGDVVEGQPAELDETDIKLLTLLLAGLTDQAVASQLGTSLRSVQRRIAALMDRAGVTTRIQLGWYASRNGWA
jgi:DNA-binding CsgD family transcriptional regulator